MQISFVEKQRKIDHINSLLGQGKDRDEIAKEMGVKASRLAEFCKKYSVPFPAYKRKIQNRKETIIQYSSKGYFRDEIAKLLGISLDSLQGWCYRHKVPLPNRSRIRDCKQSGNIIIKSSLSPHIAEALLKEAESRNTGVANLAAALLTSVVESDLYTAVIDE